MADEIIELDHEFAETAKIGFDPNDTKPEESDAQPLLPLPAKYKYLATLHAIEEILNDPDIDGNISINKNTASARINFKKLLKNSNNPDKKDISIVDKQLTLKINSLIQPNIRKLLAADGLNAADYFRSDIYFESQLQDCVLIIFWRKAAEVDNDENGQQSVQ